MASNDGWQKVWTSEGKPYYQNESTNQTQWDPPKGFIDDNSVQKQFQQYSSMTEDQWMKVFDNKGRPYFENKITGETSYDQPNSAPSSPKLGAAITQNQSSEKQHGDNKDDHDQDNKDDHDQDDHIFYGNNNQPKNAKIKQVVKQQRATSTQQAPAHLEAWTHSPLEREPLDRGQKTYFYCHIITDICCLIASILCLNLPDQWASADTNACEETVNSISSFGRAVLVLTILSMCICSVPYLCMMVYGKITDKSVKSVIVCFIFMVGAIGILWTIGLVILLWQITKGLTSSECSSIDEIYDDLVASMILLIPAILRAVYICCMLLTEHRG